MRFPQFRGLDFFGRLSSWSRISVRQVCLPIWGSCRGARADMSRPLRNRVVLAVPVNYLPFLRCLIVMRVHHEIDDFVSDCIPFNGLCDDLGATFFIPDGKAQISHRRRLSRAKLVSLDLFSFFEIESEVNRRDDE